jgi:dimethylargininase
MIVLTRPVPASFADALCAAAPDEPIDLERARDQHAAYVAALAQAGAQIEMLPAADALPDSCFVEDTAVVAAGIALITRPGAASRQPEPAATADALRANPTLAARYELAFVREPATLDGGDCMRVGTTIFVGRSARTNAAGIARLADVFEPRGLRVVAIDLPANVLHLKCVCAPLGDDRITLADGSIAADAFGDLHVVRIPADESYAANVLAIGDRVLVAGGFPRTHEALTRAGLRIVPLAMTEFRKADGALTCLSIVS